MFQAAKMCFIATLWHTIFMYHRPDLSFLPSTPHVRRILLIECLCVDVWAVSVRAKKEVNSALCCQHSCRHAQRRRLSVCLFCSVRAAPFSAFDRAHRCHCTRPAQRHRARTASASDGADFGQPRSPSAAAPPRSSQRSQSVAVTLASAQAVDSSSSSCCPDRISAR